ncbi:hypothetical protein BO221_36900 [Archangium sp. Cb G35]|uniref:hypothetical protein n=1 Tax=Archangium sp. Cb G35 TaxID=1920190 RepID=UPI00093590B9|nr:hypothetical protein [Archangium sp. Cb G35]OJT19090.1 hypothetical protein BO221_36900 [Archangium sp. Cb G35]
MNADMVARIVGPLRKAQERLSASPEVSGALHPAVNVSHFILGSGHAHNFEDYLAGFRGSDIPPLGVFSSQEEFNTWLKTHSLPPPRGTVQMAGEHYTLCYSRVSGQPRLLRLPSAETLMRPGGAEGEDRLWRALDNAHEVLDSSPEDLDALRCAALALHFVHETGCTREFARFLAHFDEPRPPLHSFATREDAEAWLRNHPSPPHGASVLVGERELTVGFWRESDQRSLVHFPKVETPGDMED